MKSSLGDCGFRNSGGLGENNFTCAAERSQPIAGRVRNGWRSMSDNSLDFVDGIGGKIVASPMLHSDWPYSGLLYHVIRVVFRFVGVVLTSVGLR